MMKILFKTLIIFTFLCNYISFSQQGTNSTPFELPDIFIEGKDKTNIRAGMKQLPDKFNSLSNEELDSINSLEKKPSFLLPLKTIPNKIYEKTFYRGFLKGEVGRYFTPLLEAGYEFEVNNYKLFVNANFEASNGHVENSDYNKLNASISSQFIAPKKYFIFGGSKTVTSFNIQNDNLKLYAIKNPADRNALTLDFDINSIGEFKGFSFETGANLQLFSLKDINKQNETIIDAFLLVTKDLDEFTAGANIEFKIDNITSFNNSFIQLNGYLSYINDFINIIAKAGIQNKSDYISNNVRVYLDGIVNININKYFTLRNNLSSKYLNLSLIDYYNINPYITDTSKVGIPDLIEFKSSLLYHPTDKYSVSLSANISSSENHPYFLYDSLGSYNLYFDKATNWGISCDADISLTEKDLINLNIAFQRKELKNTSNLIPFAPTYQIAANYRRNWNEKFGTQFGIMTFSERYTDLLNEHKLSSFFNLNAYADYKLSNNFTVYARINNLLNSNVFIWDNYKERDLFLAAGVFYKF